MNRNLLYLVILLSMVFFITAMPVCAQTAQGPQDANRSQPDAGKTEASAQLPSQDPETGMQVEQVVICQDVVQRTPIGIADVFSKDSGHLFCFTRVLGGSLDSMIIHNWYYKGNLQASVRLPVRSASWRTWSTKGLDPDMIGEWMVEILSEDGTPLHSIIFFVQ